MFAALVAMKLTITVVAPFARAVSVQEAFVAAYEPIDSLSVLYGNEEGSRYEPWYQGDVEVGTPMTPALQAEMSQLNSCG